MINKLHSEQLTAMLTLASRYEEIAQGANTNDKTLVDDDMMEILTSFNSLYCSICQVVIKHDKTICDYCIWDKLSPKKIKESNDWGRAYCTFSTTWVGILESLKEKNECATVLEHNKKVAKALRKRASFLRQLVQDIYATGNNDRTRKIKKLSIDKFIKE